jgi:MoaA/NifB/PqqE/SkfB family radical SAM enzyme
MSESTVKNKMNSFKDKKQSFSLPHFIEVEISTYCNRRCSWCPNGIYDRGRKKYSFDWALWLDLLENLRNANYSGWLAFHNYNEPLFEENIEKYISSAKKITSLAKLALYTNGDLLPQRGIRWVTGLPIDELRVTRYPRHTEPPTQKNIDDYLFKVGVNRDMCQEYITRRGLEIHTEISNTKILIIFPEIDKFNNRGGLLDNTTKNDFFRAKPCILPKISSAIDVQGNVKLCCQVYDVTLEGKEYSIGSIGNKPFVNIWNSSQFEKIRHLFLLANFNGFDKCIKCNYECTYEQWEIIGNE